MIRAQYTVHTIQSSSLDAFTLVEKSWIGDREGSHVIFSPIEALYLIHQGKMTLYRANRLQTYDQLLRLFQKQDKRIETKLLVYTNLRKKGYRVKSALKFGTDFRVYERGSKPAGTHATWLVHVTTDTDKLTWHEFAAKNRIAHSTHKKLLVAVVDSERDISYYEVSWKRF